MSGSVSPFHRESCRRSKKLRPPHRLARRVGSL